LRVALFTDTFRETNGVAMVYQRFARWCSRRGVELEIFCPGSHPTARRGSVVVHSIEFITRFPYYHDLGFDLLPLRPRLRRYFAETHFDLVHIATQGHMAILALKAAAVRGLPKISCYHTKLPEFAASRFLRFFGDNPIGRRAAALAESASWWYQRRLFSSSSLMLVPTESLRSLIEERIGVPTAIFTRGVDSDLFSPAQRRDGGRSRPVSLFVGRLSVEKNLDLLRRLDTDGSRNLEFVGDGPHKWQLQHRLPRARFLGVLKGEALARAYASADIFVFPSRTDTFGNAVLEAMSSGLAVLVTGEGGPKDFVVDGETGLVAGSDEEFVDCHSRLQADAGLRRRLGRGAREYAVSQDWDAIFENQLLGSYRRVIDGTAG